MNDVMEIKFSGESILPETIRAKDLADILANVEESLTSIILKENADVNVEDLVIGLVNIEEGSAKLRFKSSMQAVALSAFTLLSTAISTGDYTKVPVTSIKSVKSISDFTKKRNCTAEFRIQPDSKEPLAALSPQSEVNIPEVYQLTGETVIYGIVMRVGGAMPKAAVKLSDKQTIYCEVKEHLAKEIGHKLYSWVGLSGTAKWNTEDYSIDSFSIDKITEYEDIPVTKSISELSSIAGKHLKDKVDVIKTISELRS
ncbi:hypothetical protein ACFL4R_01180 [Nitrospirota bacterium]